MDWSQEIISKNERLDLKVLNELEVKVWVKREDLIHPTISGNKWRKLKYNVLEAQKKNVKGILTFGGAYSNHIAATAAACQVTGLESMGIIRGDRVLPLNDTLSFAESQGMKLHFCSRSRYREDKAGLAQEFASDELYVVPEGGANLNGLKGCQEILTEEDRINFDIVCVSAGTGTTAAGLLNTIGDEELRVYPALKGGFLKKEILDLSSKNQEALTVIGDYTFGGYAKTNIELLSFIQGVFKETGLKLDPIYTGKMVFGIVQDCILGKIPKMARILIVHTGGLQGISGIEKREGLKLF